MNGGCERTHELNAHEPATLSWSWPCDLGFAVEVGEPIAFDCVPVLEVEFPARTDEVIRAVEDAAVVARQDEERPGLTIVDGRYADREAG